MQSEIDIPETWRRLELDESRGILLVIGGADTGKSTFARFLYHSLSSRGIKTAFLDGDPGQSTLGPPSTLTVALDVNEMQLDELLGWHRRYFIGSTSPRGHMLPTVVAGARLVEAAQRAGARAVVYDTCGLIDPGQGGLNLKIAKVELLRPSMVFAIQREMELEPFLIPLRRSGRTQVVDLHTSDNALSRDMQTRREFRRHQFARYFRISKEVTVDWTRLAVFPLPIFRLKRLIALEDADSFTLSLGIVIGMDRTRKKVTLLTPLQSLQGVNSLRLGDVLVDPETFHDERISYES